VLKENPLIPKNTRSDRAGCCTTLREKKTSGGGGRGHSALLNEGGKGRHKQKGGVHKTQREMGFSGEAWSTRVTEKRSLRGLALGGQGRVQSFRRSTNSCRDQELGVSYDE